jgi:eight-cysteine-cluster-containing protein
MMFRLALVLALSTALLGCDSNTKNSPPGSKTGPDAGSVQRTPLINKNHEFYGRYEGISSQNSCSFDTDCFKGGCGQEVCSAEQGVNTTCEVLSVRIPASAGCGCMNNQCTWFTTDGSTLPSAPSTPPDGGNGGLEPAKPPPNGTSCGNKTCATGEKCIEYYGVAGPSGPRFHECGIPCHPQKHNCPEGMTCTTIADGPGPVCRRKA